MCACGSTLDTPIMHSSHYAELLKIWKFKLGKFAPPKITRYTVLKGCQKIIPEYLAQAYLECIE